MNPYKTMYVLPKDTYMALLKTSSLQSPLTPSQSPSTPSQSLSNVCPVCDLDFKHQNILAHHMKSHVIGHKCNICGKVFEHESNLHKHLVTHELQAHPMVGLELSESQKLPPLSKVKELLRCTICDKKMKHKRNLTRHMKTHNNNTLKFTTSKWETLH